jgi:hypothetical protein
VPCHCLHLRTSVNRRRPGSRPTRRVLTRNECGDLRRPLWVSTRDDA